MVTAAKMVTVKESPLSKTLPLKAKARQIKNKPRDQPEKLFFYFTQKTMNSKRQTAAML
jgi:hypothetical protein